MGRLPGRSGRGAGSAPVAFVAVFLAGFAAGCAATPWEGSPRDPATLSYAPELGIDLTRMTRTASGIYYEDVAKGVGTMARSNSLVTIHYLTWLPDGTLVDSSLGGEPFTFRLGEGSVIRGWTQNIPGMQVGGRRKMVIRPGLAYGSRGTDRVPPDATLVFEIQLVDAR